MRGEASRGSWAESWRGGLSWERCQRDRHQHQDHERNGAPATPRVPVRAPQEPGFSGFTARTAQMSHGWSSSWRTACGPQWRLASTGRWVGCKLAKSPEWVRGTPGKLKTVWHSGAQDDAK